MQKKTKTWKVLLKTNKNTENSRTWRTNKEHQEHAQQHKSRSRPNMRKLKI